jgi:hypothetical protein
VMRTFLFVLSCVSFKIASVVSHWRLAIYIKRYLNAKEELWKLKYFFSMRKYDLQKIL